MLHERAMEERFWCCAETVRRLPAAMPGFATPFIIFYIIDCAAFVSVRTMAILVGGAILVGADAFSNRWMLV